LTQTLSAADILYRYDGAALRGRPEGYNALAGWADFKGALERLIARLPDYHTVPDVR